MKNNIFIAIMLCLFCIAFIVRQIVDEKIPGYKQCVAFGNIKNVQGLFGCGCLDIWHISHFVFWAILGALVPGKYIHVIFIAILWEITEHYYYKDYIKGCDGLFCSRVEDIFLNLAGYMVGTYYLSETLLRKFPMLTKG